MCSSTGSACGRRGRSAGANNSRSLYSIGGGIRAAYGDRARLDVTLAAPLSRLPFATKREGVRLLVSFTTRLLPWRPL